jgi:hypothetical protein
MPPSENIFIPKAALTESTDASSAAVENEGKNTQTANAAAVKIAQNLDFIKLFSPKTPILQTKSPAFKRRKKLPQTSALQNPDTKTAGKDSLPARFLQ